jgi:hypothetical protein
MPRSIRSRLTFANLMSLMALFVALGGTSYAVATGSIGSRELKNNAIRSQDLRDATIRSRDVRDLSLLARDFRPGELPAGRPGPAGPRGAAGPTGPRGPAGPPTAAERQLLTESTTSDSTSPKEITIVCPAGKTAIAGGYRLGGELPNLVVRANSHPGPTFTDRWFFQVWEVPDSAMSWNLIGKVLCVKLQ